MKAARGPETIVEKGDVFFFFRPRAGVVELEQLSQVHRFYVILARDGPGPRTFRLLAIGGKRLPAPLSPRADPAELHWATVTCTTTDPDVVREELSAKRFVTIIRGERVLASARPLGEGRYWLFVHGDHTELAYVLELPRERGPEARMFNIEEQASYIVAVRNPDIVTPGIPELRLGPSYPREVRDRFGDRRWIPADDLRLIDHEHTQLLLLGTHQEEQASAELGIRLDRSRETAEHARVLSLLHAEREAIPAEPIFKGRLSQPPPGLDESLRALATAPPRSKRASPRR